MKRIFLSLLLAQVFIVLAATADEPKHLFILSGQSNMAGLRPQESFIPAVEKAFGKDNVIVVHDAQGGQPIRRWYKKWENTKQEDNARIGDLYDRLMEKVSKAIDDQEIESVTFIWMQGERDAREKNGDVYAASLKGLRNQICDDIGYKEINFVVGRLSDFDLENKRYPHWTMIREVQVEYAKTNSRTEWVDTDDLNDGKNRKGKEIKNDLHYSGEGYKILGERFAKKAIGLINRDEK